MKTITIRLDKDYEEIENIIKSIKDAGFNITEDDGTYERLRFIDIDATYVYLEFNALGICIRNMLKPHLFVAIENKYIWSLEIKFN